MATNGPVGAAGQSHNDELVGRRGPRRPDQCDVYARHGRELMGCPFDPAQGKGSPLYVNPVNVLNILTKILAEGKSKIPDFEREAEPRGTVRRKPQAKL